jgi:predicted GNAT family acetyltransferase
MPEIEIVKEMRNSRRGRYLARVAGLDGEAELVFTVRGPGLVSADHTEAPETLRGTGAAAALVARMVEDARASGFRIVPLCPYVRGRYAKTPDWADAFATRPGEVPDAAALRAPPAG